MLIKLSKASASG
jgi:FHA domain